MQCHYLLAADRHPHRALVVLQCVAEEALEETIQPISSLCHRSTRVGAVKAADAVQTADAAGAQQPEPPADHLLQEGEETEDFQIRDQEDGGAEVKTESYPHSVEEEETWNRVTSIGGRGRTIANDFLFRNDFSDGYVIPQMGSPAGPTSGGGAQDVLKHY